MPNDDKLTFLEQLSNALVGQTVTGGARALGEGIGYKYHGGAWSDIPDVMREALERHKVKTAKQTKNEQDALAVASGLAAMSNPVSAVGHGIDFAAAVPEMLEYKLSDAEPPIGMIAETGLKRRLAKGGAQADFAVANQLERAKANIRSRDLPLGEPEAFLPISSKGAKWGPGEGKFQAVDKHSSYAYDLAKKSRNPQNIGMAKYGGARIIEGHPHPLGTEFTYTLPGLAEEYLNKGLGKEIYQNQADVYGGGISHSGSTTDVARQVYKALESMDTGIPSGSTTGKVSTTRQVIPSRATRADPEAMAAFEQKVKDYAAEKQKETKSIPPRVSTMQGVMTPAESRYYANMFNENPRTVERAKQRGYLDMDELHEAEMADALVPPDLSKIGQTIEPKHLPDSIRLGERWFRRRQGSEYYRQEAASVERQEQPRQSTQPPLFTPEQNMIYEIDGRLMRLQMPRVRIPGDLVNEVFGNWQNFREQMAARGYDAKYDSVDRMFSVTRRQP